ncbi:unnamed protein product, partial [Prorocentrum cordatum]
MVAARMLQPLRPVNLSSWLQRRSDPSRPRADARALSTAASECSDAPSALKGPPRWLAVHGLDPAAPAETLIFVDVDGVLNLAVRDPEDAAPVGLSHENIDVARKVWGMRKRRLRGEPMIERIIDVHDRKLDEGEGEDATYAKLAHQEAVGLSDVLVERLARLIRAAPCCTVVLSSTWRMPEHKFRAQRLETALGHHLGSPRWAFHARTSLEPERGASDRLQRIGDFVAGHLAKGCGRRQLRVLVLDDFMVNAFHGWQCGGRPMDSCEAAERYLSDFLLASAADDSGGGGPDPGGRGGPPALRAADGPGQAARHGGHAARQAHGALRGQPHEAPHRRDR